MCFLYFCQPGFTIRGQLGTSCLVSTSMFFIFSQLGFTRQDQVNRFKIAMMISVFFIWRQLEFALRSSKFLFCKWLLTNGVKFLNFYVCWRWLVESRRLNVINQNRVHSLRKKAVWLKIFCYRNVPCGFRQGVGVNRQIGHCPCSST